MTGCSECRSPLEVPLDGRDHFFFAGPRAAGEFRNEASLSRNHLVSIHQNVELASAPVGHGYRNI